MKSASRIAKMRRKCRAPIWLSWFRRSVSPTISGAAPRTLSDQDFTAPQGRDSRSLRVTDHLIVIGATDRAPILPGGRKCVKPRLRYKSHSRFPEAFVKDAQARRLSGRVDPCLGAAQPIERGHPQQTSLNFCHIRICRALLDRLEPEYKRLPRRYVSRHKSSQVWSPGDA